MTTRAQDTAEDAGPLPDLLGLTLAELRDLDHPVLSEVLAELRERVVGKREGLWGFNQFTAEPGR